ncbi:MAG: hypothetical protein Q7V31_17340, partial [Parvibaculum sp.]|uniref:hypothetical protein n=1 Tax=Parvibaculum sp. TaxID=2024848 RepID=UPI002726093E|nr:hypothetical protein [Parvibaculum sp.]
GAAGGAAGAAGAAGGLQAGLAAVPVWGWIALAAMTVKGFVEGADPGSPKGAINTLLLPSIEEWQKDPGRSFANAIDPIGLVMSDFGLPSFLTPGGLLGSLLGKKEPSDKAARTNIDIGSGDIGEATFSSGKRSQKTIDASQQMARVFLDVAQAMEKATGGVGALHAFVIAGERDGFRAYVGDRDDVKHKDADVMKFKTAEAALEWMIETFISKIEGGNPEVMRVAALNKGKGAEEMVNAMMQAKAILDALGALAANDNISQGEQAVRQLTEEIEALRIAARDIGLSDAIQAEIGAAERMARDRLTKGFDDAVARAILSALDPVRLAWNDMMDVQTERLRNVAALSGDVGETQRLNLIEQQMFLASLSAEQRAALGELIDLAGELGFRLGEAQAAALALATTELQTMQARGRELENNAAQFTRFAAVAEQALVNLRGGALSPLTPAQKLAEARTRLDALSARAFDEGDMEAMGQLPAAVQAFVDASRGYHADAGQFLADFAFGESVLEAMHAAGIGGAEAASAELEALEASRDLLEEIRDALASASPDAELLTAHMTALAALELEGAAAIADKLAELIALTQEAAAAIASAPPAPAPVYTDPLEARPEAAVPPATPPPPAATPPAATPPLGSGGGRPGRNLNGRRFDPRNFAGLDLPRFATGGLHVGPGSGTSDSLLGRFSAGEFTLRASAVRTYGLPFVQAVNEGTLRTDAANDREKLGPRLEAIERRLVELTGIAAAGAEGTIGAIEEGNAVAERTARAQEAAVGRAARGTR